MADWNPRVNELFLRAYELADPDARRAFLERECGGDADLRRAVGTLLKAHDDAGGFLADSPPGMGATADMPSPGRTATFGDSSATADFAGRDEHVGAVLGGKYKLIEAIGEGGMGSVYMAQQTEPVKRAVAVKVIKAGMDSKAVLARFEAERQALAMMDHPNIAKVLDAGTTENGRPYFVMELVKGAPITQFCDERKLTPRQRLELFVPVCLAIQHAHQKGVIHRDIKPSNVIVALYDNKPVPKVIDFGVAKATGPSLTDRTLMTGFGAVVGTPEYMSPEQASLNNLDIDTRSDVYALGVLLYELLTGTTPVDRKSLEKAALLDVLRIVREVEAPRPSAKLSSSDTLPSVAANRGTEPAKLSKLMKGELDWVLLKALEKDRSRRYETANALARDLQRYLADEVIEARPPSAGYRVRKFVHRHKGQVIAAGLVLFVLLGGIIGTGLGLVQAGRARDGERAEREKAEGLAEKNAKLADDERDAKNKATELASTNAKLADDESKARNKAEHQLGVSNLLLAGAAYDNGDVKLAAERLDKVPKKQRGWEWHHLKQKVRGGIFTLAGHKNVVTSVAFSPDGTRIVSSGGLSQELEVKVWDARTGAFLFDLKGFPEGQQGGVWKAAFSPDSTRIITGDFRRVGVWDARTGALQLELNDPGPCAAFSPDGTRIVTGGRDRTAAVRDARTGTTLFELKGHENTVTSAAFSPDGTRIVTTSHDQAVRVWDAGTGKRLLEVRGMLAPLGGDAAFSPDGRRIVAGGERNTARVIDARSGAVLLELQGRPRGPRSGSTPGGLGGTVVAYSPDGTRIVTGGGAPSGFRDVGVVWDARTGAELLDLKGHTDFVTSVAFSPDGTQIATASMDRTVKVWDARTGTPRLDLLGPVAGVSNFSVNPDGTRIATTAEDKSTGRLVHTVKVWDARTGTEQFTLRGHELPVRSVCFSPDGTRILTGSGTDVGSGGKKPGELKVWDARTGAALLDLKGLKEGVFRAAFSPDGTRVISGGSFYDAGNDDGKEELKVWDAQTGRTLLDLTQPGAGGLVLGGGPALGASVAYSPDGTRFAVGGHGLGGDVRVCDAQTGAPLVHMNAQMVPVYCVAFSPDGTRIAVGSGDRTARVFDARTGKLLAELKGHTGAVASVAFSPDRDGARLVTGSEDRTVRVWDVRTGTALIELKGHKDMVTGASFTPDGSRIVSAGDGERGKPGNVFVWYGRVLTPPELQGHTGPVTSVSFSPDSSRVATASGDGTVRIWDTRTGAMLHNLGGVRSNVPQLMAFSPDGTRLVTPRDQNYATVWDARTGTAVFDLKGREGFEVHVASFTPDGTRIVTRSAEGGKALVWDARTGKEVLNEPIPVTQVPGLTSPDGRLLARAVGFGVELVALKPDPEELEYRLLHTGPNPRRYREAYLAARAAKDDFAAAFYLNLVPPADRQAVLAQADVEAFAALALSADEYKNSRRFDDAVPLLIEILNVNRAKLGPEDPATIQSMDDLGRTYHRMGQFAKAVPVLEDVWKARKAKEGPASPQTRSAMQLLIESCQLAGEHAKIVDLLVEQLPADRKSMPADSPELANVLAQLGGAYLGQEMWAKAEPLLRECVTIREKSQPNYWNTFDAQSMLGGALLGQKKHAEAGPLLLKGYEGMKAREKTIPPKWNARIPEALDRLIELYTATGKPDEAQKWSAERAKYPTPKEVAPPPREKK